MLRVLYILIVLSCHFWGYTQTVSTYAGNGNAGFPVDNVTATNSPFNYPISITTDDDNNLYIVDNLNHVIRKVDYQTKIITSIVTSYTSGLGLPISPTYITYGNGKLFFLDTSLANTTQILKYDLANGNGSAEILGSGISLGSNSYGGIKFYNNKLYLTNKTASNFTIISNLNTAPQQNSLNIAGITFTNLNGLTFNSTGEIIVCDGATIKKINIQSGVFSTIASGLDNPVGIDIASDGTIYVSDIGDDKIYKIDGNGLSLYAGSTPFGYNDGDLLTAKFQGPFDISIDNFNDVYIADAINNVIRVIPSCVSAEKPIVELQSYSEEGCPQELYFHIPFTSNLLMNDNQNWIWYSGIGCGDVVMGSGDTLFFNTTSQDASFFVRGEGGCATPGDCKEVVFDGLDCLNDVPKDSIYSNIYNAFSPNKDGVNDVWIIDNIEPNTTVLIFNRWGDLIKEIENYDNINNVWDGTSKVGVTVSAGTYFYAIESNNKKIASGWVEVVR